MRLRAAADPERCARMNLYRPLRDWCAVRRSRRAVVPAVAVVLLTAAMTVPFTGPAVSPAAASEQQQLVDAYDRALLIGRVFNDRSFTQRASAAITARVESLSADVLAGGIAGPPDLSDDELQRAAGNVPQSAPQEADEPDARAPSRGLLGSSPSHGTSSSERLHGQFEVADQADEVQRHESEAPAASGEFVARGVPIVSGRVEGQVAGGRARVGAGGFVCPTPSVTWFTNDWGFPRSGGRSHQGNDLFAPEGSPVVAVAAATVIRVQHADVGLGGRTVSYLTDDGDVIYNAHLHTIPAALTVGSRVSPGEPIGTVGRTGNARTTPPHLHMGIYPGGGAAVSPYPYTSRACR